MRPLRANFSRPGNLASAIRSPLGWGLYCLSYPGSLSRLQNAQAA